MKKQIVKLSPGVFGGKILVAEIHQAIPDGASEYETNGFIDGNDCPPIDTWFYAANNKHGIVLYAWIPERFISVVQDGIDVNALDIFKWESDFNPIEGYGLDSDGFIIHL